MFKQKNLKNLCFFSFPNSGFRKNLDRFANKLAFIS